MALTKVTGDFIKVGSITQAHLHTSHGITSSHIAEGTNLYYTDARADARVALIVDSAPGTLNTLNELAAALGDDANFSTTVTNSIATKLPLAGGTMSGNIQMSGNSLLLDQSGTRSWNVFASGGNLNITSGDSAGNLALTTGLTVADASTFAGNISLNNNNKITFDKTNTASGGDFDFIEMGYNGSWSNNQGGLAAISVDDGTGVVGRYGITYGTGGGRFVITDLYDGGYGASGDVFSVRGDGAATFAGTIDSGTITSTGIVKAATTFQSTSGSMLFFVPNVGQALEIAQNTGNATFAGDIELAANLFSTGQNLKFHAAGTHVMNIDVNGKVYPATHNAYDIGHSTSLAWRNIYSSGTIFGTTATFAADVTINSAGDAASPILRLNNSSSNSFNHALEAINANLTAGETELLLFGKATSTRNSGFIGYNWNADNNNNNYVSIGHWGYNHLFRVYPDQVLSTVTLRTTVDMQSPVYYDKDNTAYYTNPASRSNLGDLTLNSGAVWDATTQGQAIGALHLDPNSATDHAGAAITFGASDHSSGSVADAGIYVRSDGSYGTRMYLSTTDSYASGSKTTIRLEAAGGLYVDRGSLYAPVYYDKDDTTYYVDPNSTTSLKTVGSWRANSSTWDGEYAGKMQYHGNWWYIQTTNGVLVRNPSGANNITLSSAGSGTATNDWRAPQFYDSADTSYYLNPNGTSNLNAINAVGQFATTLANGFRVDSGSYARMELDSNSDWSYIRYQNNGSVSWDVAVYQGGQYELRPGGSGTNSWTYTSAGHAQAGASSRAPIFYDSNDTGHYLDPASTSVVNTVRFSGSSNNGRFDADEWGVRFKTDSGYLLFGPANSSHAHIYTDRPNVYFNAPITVSGGSIMNANDIRSAIFYDLNDTTYYVNPGVTSSNSTSHSAKFRQSVQIGDSSVYNQNDGGWGARLIVSDDVHARIDVAQDANSMRSSWYSHTGHGGSYFGMVTGHNLYLTSHNQTRQTIANGYSQEAGSYRAPIFYDSANTGYYVDAADGSQLAAPITFLTNDTTLSFIDAGTNAFQIKVGAGDELYLGSNNAYQLQMTTTGNVNTQGNWVYPGQVQINTSSSVVGSQLKIYSTTNHQYPQIHSNAALEAMWNYKHSAAEWYVGLRTSSQLLGNTGFHFYNTTSGQTVGGWDINGHSYSIGSSRAPLFYDSNDTNYYFDLANITLSGKLRSYLLFNDFGAGIVGSYSANRYQLVFAMGNSYKAALDGTNVTGGYGLWYSHPNAGGVAANLSSHGLMNIVNGAWHASLDASTRAATDMRAPIFYDLNDTTYYVDPNASSITNNHNIKGTINFPSSGGTTHSASHRPAYGIYQEGGSWSSPFPDLAIAMHTGIKFGANATYNGMRFYNDYTMATQVMSINNHADGLGSNHVFINNSLQAAGSLRTPLFYDSDNTTYYTNPASTSNINALTLVGNLSGQSGFFAQKMSIGHTGTAGGTIHLQRNSAGTSIKSNLGSALTSSTIGLLQYTSASMFSNGYHLVFQAAPGSGSDTNMLLCDINGNLRNRNNSYGQYSDIKLKENISDATPKLEDINKLKVKNFNLKGDDLKQIGLIAQEVEQVFPSLVEDTISPDGEDIKSLKYSVLVPILIKGMQEQQVIINDLKTRLETLENQ